MNTDKQTFIEMIKTSPQGLQAGGTSPGVTPGYFPLSLKWKPDTQQFTVNAVHQDEEGHEIHQEGLFGSENFDEAWDVFMDYLEDETNNPREKYSEIPWEELLSDKFKKNIEIEFDDEGHELVRIHLYEEE